MQLDALGQRMWAATAPVQIDKTVESIREMQREVAQYASGKVPAKADEVARIQATSVRRLPGSYETAAAVVDTIVEIVRYGRPDDWAAQRAARIEAMTPAQVNAAVGAIKPAALTWIIVGDLKTHRGRRAGVEARRGEGPRRRRQRRAVAQSGSAHRD